MKARILLLVAAMITLAAGDGFGQPVADWHTVLQEKAKYLAITAQHAMEQQQTDQAPPVDISFPGEIATAGNLQVTAKSAQELSIDVLATPNDPSTFEGTEVKEAIRIKLPQAMDMLAPHSGLALIVKAADGTSPEVRVGLRLINVAGKLIEARPAQPVLSPWGDPAHELYFDWAYLRVAQPKVGVDDALEVLKSVTVVEFTFASIQRAPHRGASDKAQHAAMKLSSLRLVDYLKGTYDSERQSLVFDEAAGKMVRKGKVALIMQQRSQEVTGIVAMFGGAAGVTSAIDALDMACRTQCWEGSFLDMWPKSQGEYTFGFTLDGMLTGYMALDKAHCPALDEKITIGPDTLTRREFYLRMLYRGAMSRTAAIPSQYFDDLLNGSVIMSGCNRALGYAIAMRLIADVLPDPAQKKEILAKFGPIMKDIADSQGQCSGGFPLLGEGGNQYRGPGIHYDSDYTRTHIECLVMGVARTGDPLMIQILRRYQEVLEAVVDANGTGLLPMFSERHPRTAPALLNVRDNAAQVGLLYHLPILAQLGYNEGLEDHYSFFKFASTVRGYPLGAWLRLLPDDLMAEPLPKDLGYLFPRQFPAWSTRCYAKDGHKLLRTSTMVFAPDGTQVSDYHVDIGEVPETVGVPVTIKSAGKVTVVAEKLSGWPKLLPVNAAVQISGDLAAHGQLGQPIALKLAQAAKLVITGPETILPPEADAAQMPFRAELTITPERPDQEMELTVLGGTVAYRCQYPLLSAAPRRGRQN